MKREHLSVGIDEVGNGVADLEDFEAESRDVEGMDGGGEGSIGDWFGRG